MTPPARRSVVVVGGGVTGLAAAEALCRGGGDAVAVTLLEAAPQVGGKLAVAQVAGVPVDQGAESMLARRPEGVALARAAGLGDDVVVPATTSARVWSRGRLRPLPAGQLLGVPADLRALATSHLLSGPELARVPLDHLLPATAYDGDVAVGRLVAARLGRAVVDRLVDPLLGGVYAGRADELSLRATVPQLASALDGRRSLLAAARRARAASAPTSTTGPPAPLFASVRGGLGRLPPALADRLRASHVQVRTGATVRELRRTRVGWALTVGAAGAAEQVAADGVVLAVPARPAARLLAGPAPAAAAQVAGIDYASVAIVTLAYRRADLSPPPGSGFLVPAVEGRLVKAATFTSAKWGWYADPAAGGDPALVVVRVSIGRHGEEADLHRDDDELVATAAGELAAAVGGRVAPVDARVTRWGGGLPQYAVRHLDRVARARAGLAGSPGLAVCGAAYDGVGVPACVASGRAAAAEVLAALGVGENGGHD